MVVYIYAIPLILNYRNWLNGIRGVLYKVKGSNFGVIIFIGGLFAFRQVKTYSAFELGRCELPLKYLKFLEEIVLTLSFGGWISHLRKAILHVCNHALWLIVEMIFDIVDIVLDILFMRLVDMTFDILLMRNDCYIGRKSTMTFGFFFLH